MLCSGVAVAPPLDRVDADYSGPSACCLLYTSDAADERSSVDLGGRRIIKKKKNMKDNDRQVSDR